MPLDIVVLAYSETQACDTYDGVMDQVVESLQQAGHSARVLCLHSNLHTLITELSNAKPDLVFNLVENFGRDVPGGLMGVTGVLDLLQLSYTGGGPGEIYLQEDKALSKKLLNYEEVLYPDFAIFSRDSEFETGGRLRMPLFVKPLRMDSSVGIDGKTSLVHTATDLMERVLDIHKRIGDSALAEEYIEGREFYVGVLGNNEPLALPPVEIDFTGFPEGQPKVMDANAKFAKDSPEYQGTKAVIAELSDDLRAKLQKVALEAYHALRVRDYGRIDLRLTEAGEIFVIEVNANCYLDRDSEFAISAAAAGIPFPELVQKIANLALARAEGRRPVATQPATA